MKSRKIATLLLSTGLLVGTLTLTSDAFAKAYGTAGCGLGSVIFGDDPGMVQILAATTNGTSGNQTFGMTSGTLNCADTGPSVASVVSFVETNREAFTKDAARGSGETIGSVAILAGCADKEKTGAILQSNMNTIAPSASATDKEISMNVVKVLRSNPELNCAHII